ncbi:uncharacterized protein LOC134321947 isoform X2 [Trichomycterus rosablanca]|uniref:uncharacterized protein LOC134321947 isoform X2 n=1 Tax=Trichomycterus rosablanca TaxID=2290929 RepID=UPI002F35F084
MILLFCLLLNVAPIAEGKCALNFYYDGLLDDCQPCSVRCKSPPTVCATYCKPTTSSINEAGEKNNVRVILIVLFVFFGACITLTLILQVMRRKTCKPLIKTKVCFQQRNHKRHLKVREVLRQLSNLTMDPLTWKREHAKLTATPAFRFLPQRRAPLC